MRIPQCTPRQRVWFDKAVAELQPQNVLKSLLATKHTEKEYELTKHRPQKCQCQPSIAEFFIYKELHKELSSETIISTNEHKMLHQCTIVSNPLHFTPSSPCHKKLLLLIAGWSSPIKLCWESGAEICCDDDDGDSLNLFFCFHTVRVPKDRKGWSQAGLAGCQLEVGAKRSAPKLLVSNICLCHQINQCTMG